jgi:hypothetical protein
VNVPTLPRRQNPDRSDLRAAASAQLDDCEPYFGDCTFPVEPRQLLLGFGNFLVHCH